MNASSRLPLIRYAFPVFLALTAGQVWADRADRDKPIHVEANSLQVDDEKRIQILEGDVLLTQGTLLIKAKRMVITEDHQGFQYGVATGGPKGKAYFRQKREGRTDYVEGESERIEYNTRIEVAEFFQQAWIKSGQDLIKGNYIWYDALSEKYRANGNPPSRQGTPAPAGEEAASVGRVRAVLQPRRQAPETGAPASSTNTPLRSSNELDQK